MTSLQEMRRELRRRYEKLKGRNPDEWWLMGADDLEKRQQVDSATKEAILDIGRKYIKENLRGYQFIDSRTSTDPFSKNSRICTSSHMAWAVPGAEETVSGREKVIYLNPDWFNSLDEKFRAFLLAHEKGHIDADCIGDEACATLWALDHLDLTEEEKKDVAKRWYGFWAHEGLYGHEKYISQLKDLLTGEA